MYQLRRSQRMVNSGAAFFIFTQNILYKLLLRASSTFLRLGAFHFLCPFMIVVFC